MKTTFIKTALIAALLVPAFASAKNTTTYNSVTLTDSYSFTLSELSNISVGYKWSDLLMVKNAKSNEYNATTLGWTLTNTSAATRSTPLSGSFADVSGDTSGKDTLSLTGLAAGTYALTMTGVWSGASVTGNGWTYVAPTLNLKQKTFSATAVTAVPEPESFAMMLAGLGLMGSIAMRRKSKNKAA